MTTGSAALPVDGDVVLYWLHSQREPVRTSDVFREHVTARYEQAARAAGMTLVPVTVDDITITDAEGAAAIRVLGEEVGPRHGLFHTAPASTPANMPDMWRYLTTTGALEAAGFCVTVPAQHGIEYSDSFVFLSRFGEFGVPSLPTVRVCTREIEVHEKNRFRLPQWGLNFPVVVRPAHGAGGAGGEFVADTSRRLSTIFQLHSASETTVLVQPWLGEDTTDHRVHCFAGEPDDVSAAAPDHVVASARKIAREAGLPYLRIDFIEARGEFWLSGVDLGVFSGDTDATTAVRQSLSYRSHFDRFTSGDRGVRLWTYAGPDNSRSIPRGEGAHGERGPETVMYWIRSERESTLPNPGHVPVNALYDAIFRDLGMTVRPISAENIVVGHTGTEPAVYVRGVGVRPDETFFHTMLMTWPTDRFDIWQHLTTYAALEAAGYFTTVPTLHSVINNDKILTGLSEFGSGLRRVPTVRVTTRGYDADALHRCAAALAAAGIGYPLIVKPAHWGAGYGVFVARSEAELDTVLATARAAEFTMVVQPWLGRDVVDHRVFCVDGEPCSTLGRRPVGDAVAGNLGQGGAMALGTVPDVLRGPAREVAKAVGMPYVCVDFLMTGDDWWLSEIEIDGGSTLDDFDTTRARFASYLARFDMFVATGTSDSVWRFEENCAH